MVGRSPTTVRSGTAGPSPCATPRSRTVAGVPAPGDDAAAGLATAAASATAAARTSTPLVHHNLTLRGKQAVRRLTLRRAVHGGYREGVRTVLERAHACELARRHRCDELAVLPREQRPGGARGVLLRATDGAAADTVLQVGRLREGDPHRMGRVVDEHEHVAVLHAGLRRTDVVAVQGDGPAGVLCMVARSFLLGEDRAGAECEKEGDPEGGRNSSHGSLLSRILAGSRF